MTDTSEQRENRPREIPKCLSLGDAPDRAVFQNTLRRATRQAVKCFRRANFNNVASQEAQQRRPLPCSGALWHRCVFVPALPLSPSAFLPVCLREHPFFKFAPCLRSLPSTTNATELLHNLLGFSYLFDSFSPEYLPSRNIQRVLIIFRFARE